MKTLVIGVSAALAVAAAFFAPVAPASAVNRCETGQEKCSVGDAILAQVQYACRWDKIGGAGGAWTTGWVPNHPTAFCGASAVNRVCGSANFSAAQPSGAQISYWPQGCTGPQWTIQCTCKQQ